MPAEQSMEEFMMEHCKNCKWYSKRVYHVNNDFTCVLRGMMYPEHIEICKCYERKEMSTKEAYKVLHDEWIKSNNVEDGDIVKVLRTPKEKDELGSETWAATGVKNMVGREYKIDSVFSNRIVVDGWSWPFFCLEFVKKAEPKIEITVKINGKTSKLSDISKETLLNIRNQT